MLVIPINSKEMAGIYDITCTLILIQKYGNTNFIFNIFNYFSIHYVRPMLHGTQSEDLE